MRTYLLSRWYLAAFCLAMFVRARVVRAVQPAGAKRGQNQNVKAAPVPAAGPQNGFLFGPNANTNNNGQRGAAANADFDSLIDLIRIDGRHRNVGRERRRRGRNSAVPHRCDGRCGRHAAAENESGRFH